MAAEELLQIRELKYSYNNGVSALGGVSMDILSGQVSSLVGPSGCGKSTLLAAICGLVRPDGGQVQWRSGRDDLDRKSSRHRVSLVFQKDTLLPWLSVRKNVAFGLRYTDLTKQEVTRRVDSLLDMVGLSEFHGAFPKELSGGMRRRVALLMGVAPMPQLLLLDEPFTGLDEPTRLGVHREFVKLIQELNMTAMIVTHDLSEALTLSDVVYVMSRRPTTVFTRYEIPFARKRDIFEVRETADYQQAYAHLWHDLCSQID
jgi:NitT/TauT family transport system ATP-binding protein